MKAEDVPAELVEKAARARTSAQHGRPLHDAVWSAVRSRIEEVWIASALAAVLPEYAATVLEEAADVWQRGAWADAPRRADRVQERIANGKHVSDWLRARAARLTATTDGTTT